MSNAGRTRLLVALLTVTLVGSLGAFEPAPATAADPSPLPEPLAPAEPKPPDAEPFPLPTGRPVELPDPDIDAERVDLRTETSRTFDLGDGRLVAELFSEQVFYRPAGATALEPIDLTFRSDGAAAVTDRSPVSVRVGATRPGDPVLALVGPDGFRLAYRPLLGGLDLGAVTAPVARLGAVADLSRVFPDADLRVVARADGANVFSRPARPAGRRALDVRS